jgi:hypothetical protein
MKGKSISLPLVLFSTALLVFGCIVRDPEREPFSAEQVTPTARITLGESETIAIAMGFVNESSQPIPQQDDFAGQWVLINGEGKVRARGRVPIAGPLGPDATSFPLVWSGVLQSGSFTLKWGSPAIGTAIVQFTVFDNGSGVGVVRQETSEQFLIDQGNETK